jgi:hypothetical protein
VTNPKTCLFCKHFDIYESEPDYSEWTPGSDAQFTCGKGVFEDQYFKDTFREFIQGWAAKCFYYYDITEEGEEK